MAVGYDRRQLWDNFVASILFDCRSPHNGGRMAQERKRPFVDTTISPNGDTALVCYSSRLCLDRARCTVLQQMDADSSAYNRNCNRSIIGVRAIRACATRVLGISRSPRQLLLAAGSTRGRRGVCVLPP